MADGLYQNRKGSIEFTDGGSDRIDIGTLAFNTDQLFICFRFVYTGSDEATLCIPLRFGLNGNTPSFGIRVEGTDGAGPDYATAAIGVRFTKSGGGSLNVFTDTDSQLVEGREYAVVAVYSQSGGSGSIPTGDSSTGYVSLGGTGRHTALLIYDQTQADPEPVIVQGSAGTPGTLDTQTGIQIGPTSGRIGMKVSDLIVFIGNDGNEDAADIYGKRTGGIGDIETAVGATADGHWTLDNYSTGSIAGTEIELDDQIGSNDASVGASTPTWNTTSIARDYTSTDDPVYDELFGAPRETALSKIKSAISSSSGCMLFATGDSFNRMDLTARASRAIVERAVSDGLAEVTAITPYIREASGGGVNMTINTGALTNTTTRTLNNAAVAGSFLNGPSGSATRFGMTTGGMLEMVAGASPGISGDGTFVTFSYVGNNTSNALGGNFFGDGDQLWARILVYIPDGVSNLFDGTLEVVVNGGTAVEIDMGAAATEWRGFAATRNETEQNDETGVAFSQGAVNAYKIDLDMGTSGTTRTVAFRIKDAGTDWTVGDTIFVLAPTVYKGPAKYSPTPGLHVICNSDNSASLEDFSGTSAATSDGEKKRTLAQQYMFHDSIRVFSRNCEMVQHVCLATENQTKAQFRSDLLAIASNFGQNGESMGMNKTPLSLLLDNFPHAVTGVNSLNDCRTLASEYAEACKEIADENPMVATSYSCYDWVKGFMFTTRQKGITEFTDQGFGEGDEAAADSDLSTRFSGSGTDILDSNVLHLADETAATEMYAGLSDAIRDANGGLTRPIRKRVRRRI